MAARLALAPEYQPRPSGESVLHRVVRENLATFLAETDAAERPVPRFVVRAFEDLLACGDPRRGFLRCLCEGCGHELLVPFACHRRAPCPSCGGRRMAEIAMHLADNVIPEVPVRQWVLSLPFPLRYVLAYDSKLCSLVLGTFVRTVFAWLRQTAMSELTLAESAELHCGAVTAIQRAGGAANLNLHYHSAVLDGVFVLDGPEAAPHFRALRGPSRGELLQLGWSVCQKVTKLLQQRGIYLDGDATEDRLAQDEPLLAACVAGSLQNRQVLGPRAGQRVLALGAWPLAERGGNAGEQADHGRTRNKPAHGFDVHAGRRVKAADRKGRERLLRYMLRPPLSHARLAQLRDGRVKLRLQRPWSNGTTHLVFAPVDFLARLTPLVPPPRVHQVVTHGVLAPRSKLRTQVAPPPREDKDRSPKQLGLPAVAKSGNGSASATRTGSTDGSTADTPHPRRRQYVPWAVLMKRSLELDPLSCTKCGKRMRVVASVTSPEAIRTILEARGIWSARRPASPARAPPQLPLPFTDSQFSLRQARRPARPQRLTQSG
jgi:hypothetical protein